MSKFVFGDYGYCEIIEHDCGCTEEIYVDRDTGRTTGYRMQFCEDCAKR
jgi:hypothetical protein